MLLPKITCLREKERAVPLLFHLTGPEGPWRGRVNTHIHVNTHTRIRPHTNYVPSVALNVCLNDLTSFRSYNGPLLISLYPYTKNRKHPPFTFHSILPDSSLILKQVCEKGQVTETATHSAWAVTPGREPTFTTWALEGDHLHRPRRPSEGGKWSCFF